ncbi:hypothetical protein EDC46_1615 [Vespertiliibacter pulmonis]|uniref:Uncharacterized protein n=1 Tax=Vespertiliibacter pulmonis TaxID=1443036 RepID=A0A3N4VDU3_9PAST|nr:hypothetical protein [Vespertiliibacter pulmonis]RPE80798.1 hypothetical protein EDC46_1615 [Vespertiliibacter pulmonis]
MIRKRKLRQRTRRLNSNKSHRILRLYRLKRRISNRHRIGFVILNPQQ